VPDPPQVDGPVHVPQSSVPPQSSEIVSQSFAFAAHVVLVHVPTPHLLAPAAPHVSLVAHVPQLSKLPQPSGAEPQLYANEAQVAGVQTQWLFWQTDGAAQEAQIACPPHWSAIDPHSAPSSAQDLGLHAQTPCTPPPPHVLGEVQVPQESDFPQPSDASPQSSPSVVHVFGVHVPVPQVFGPEPPHVSPAGHVPQSSVFPQPSGKLPQLAARSLQVFGTHASVFASDDGASFPDPASLTGP
jgi:hypothetical protein